MLSHNTTKPIYLQKNGEPATTSDCHWLQQLTTLCFDPTTQLTITRDTVVPHIPDFSWI